MIDLCLAMSFPSLYVFMIYLQEATTKSAVLSVQLAQNVLVTNIEDVLDNELTETHADIVAKAEKALDDKKRQDQWKANFGVREKHTEKKRKRMRFSYCSALQSLYPLPVHVPVTVDWKMVRID